MPGCASIYQYARDDYYLLCSNTANCVANAFAHAWGKVSKLRWSMVHYNFSLGWYIEARKTGIFQK